MDAAGGGGVVGVAGNQGDVAAGFQNVAVLAEVREDFRIEDEVVAAVVLEGRLLPGRVKAVVFLEEILVQAVEGHEVLILQVQLRLFCRLALQGPFVAASPAFQGGQQACNPVGEALGLLGVVGVDEAGEQGRLPLGHFSGVLLNQVAGKNLPHHGGNAGLVLLTGADGLALEAVPSHKPFHGHCRYMVQHPLRPHLGRSSCGEDKHRVLPFQVLQNDLFCPADDCSFHERSFSRL